jgi:hypothetical protein
LEQIRRNSEEFGRVVTLLYDYKDAPDRRKLINLYALKPSDKLEDRILINKLKENAATLYNMSYESILQYLEDKSQKLFRENAEPLYYFKSSASSSWIKFPFEFTGKLRKKAFHLSIVK